MPRSLLLVGLGVLMSAAAVTSQNTSVEAASAAIGRTSARAMVTVASTLVRYASDRALDERIQHSPAAAKLGGVWRSSDPRFQKAREALNARVTRVAEAYAASPDLGQAIRQAVGTAGPSPALDAAIVALQSPAGPQIVRRQAQRTFGARTVARQGQGSEDEAGYYFARAAGAGLPPEDAAHAAEAEQVLGRTPAADVLRQIWNAAIATAERQITARVEQMLAADPQAIDQDVAAAIGDAPPTAGSFPLEHMATCQASFFDIRNDPVLAPRYGVDLETRFRYVPREIYLTPVGRETLLGFPVQSVQASLGRSDGFWVTIDASFEQAKAAVEAAIGKALTQCETVDGVRKCQLSIAEKRTVTLQSGKPKETLVGCLYFSNR